MRNSPAVRDAPLSRSAAPVQRVFSPECVDYTALTGPGSTPAMSSSTSSHCVRPRAGGRRACQGNESAAIERDTDRDCEAPRRVGSSGARLQEGRAERSAERRVRPARSAVAKRRVEISAGRGRVKLWKPHIGAEAAHLQHV